MAKAIKLDKKTTKMILIVAVVAVLAVGIFLLVKNLPSGANNPVSESNASQATVKDPQLNAILGSTDSSEPNDAATTIDSSNVVDSTGLT